MVLEQYKVKIVQAEGKADDVLAKLRGVAVATMDAELKRRLKGKSEIVILRQTNHLEIA